MTLRICNFYFQYQTVAATLLTFLSRSFIFGLSEDQGKCAIDRFCRKLFLRAGLYKHKYEYLPWTIKHSFILFL